MLAMGVNCATTSGRVINLVYLANFYYTALRDYYRVAVICDRVTHFPGGCLKDAITTLSFDEQAFPIFITNELSAIFDDNFRTVLGLITLHRYIVDSAKSNSGILIRIRPSQYLMYLKIQCKIWKGVDESEIKAYFKRKNPVHLGYDAFEPLSEVFMSAVLHASRCQY